MYEESSDLTEFFLKLENAMKAAQEATDSVMAESQMSIYLFHSMTQSWKNDLRIWKGRRKYIPYEDLKQSIEGKVRDIQAQERYTLAKGTPETSATKNERVPVAIGSLAPQDEARSDSKSCSYRDRPRHNIRQLRGLQNNLRDGELRLGPCCLRASLSRATRSATIRTATPRTETRTVAGRHIRSTSTLVQHALMDTTPFRNYCKNRMLWRYYWLILRIGDSNR
ncbi:unnamed protein product [Phytophthora fragariaefolia]|uniref:Unnamed protein product n=1 Tax=Phytophthora fragariaefolia TaxID=1490495 RepID=A0A9W6XRT1_9STRA|nr:unnamed protein product [Phytophthora fragariaefolia]